MQIAPGPAGGAILLCTDEEDTGVRVTASWPVMKVGVLIASWFARGVLAGRPGLARGLRGRRGRGVFSRAQSDFQSLMFVAAWAPRRVIRGRGADQEQTDFRSPRETRGHIPARERRGRWGAASLVAMGSGGQRDS